MQPFGSDEVMGEQRLLFFKTIAERNELASSPTTPPLTLVALACDPSHMTRASVAKNPSTPVQALARLVRDESMLVRATLAQHGNLPQSVAEQLMLDSVWNVRDLLASNHNLPVSLLETLAKDEAVKVRSSVARNPAAPLPIIMGLLGDHDYQVASAAAIHPSLPVDVLLNLVKETDNLAVIRVLSAESSASKEVLAAIAGHPDRQARATLARNPGLPSHQLSTLAADEYRPIRVGVAVDAEIDVRVVVAKHPHITFETASLLATDERVIREALAANSATPVDVLLNLHFGDKSKNVIDSSFVSIKRQPVEAWGRAAERGLSLDDHMAGKSLGEWLLERGLTEAYQAVQVASESTKWHDLKLRPIPHHQPLPTTN